MKKQFLIPILILTTSLVISGETYAKKTSFSFGKGKKIKVIKSFISSSGVATKAKKRSNRVSAGEKIFFYYKVGPVKSKKGKGAPYKTKLIIKKGSKIIKDFGWQPGNVAGKNQRNKKGSFKWFHTAGWNFTVSPKLKQGNYKAEIQHKDLNSKKILKIKYNFTVSGKSQANNNKSSDLSGFIQAYKRKNNKIMRYVVSDIEFTDCKKWICRKADFKEKLSYWVKHYRYIKKHGRDNKNNLYMILSSSKELTADTVNIYFKKKGGRLVIYAAYESCQG